MDLFNLELNESEQAELARLRSQINIGRAVLHHRLENQMSQAELAKQAETTQARVSEVEAMKGDPKLSTLGRIARALGCMIDLVPIPAAGVVSGPTGSNAAQFSISSSGTKPHTYGDSQDFVYHHYTYS